MENQQKNRLIAYTIIIFCIFALAGLLIGRLIYPLAKQAEFNACLDRIDQYKEQLNKVTVYNRPMMGVDYNWTYKELATPEEDGNS